jgi:hypothetical protein
MKSPSPIALVSLVLGCLDPSTAQLSSDALRPTPVVTAPSRCALGPIRDVVVLDPAFLGARIPAPSIPDPRLEDFIDNVFLKDLGRMVGRPFSRTLLSNLPCGSSDETAIFVISRATLAAARSRPGRHDGFLDAVGSTDLAAIAGKPQAFVLDALPGRGTVIVADGWRGAQHGLVHLLYRLGARYLLPDARSSDGAPGAWTVLPARRDLRLRGHTVQAPAFDTLHWAPQGGSYGSGMYRPGSVTGDPLFQMKAWWRWLALNQRPVGHGTAAEAPERMPSGDQGIMSAFFFDRTTCDQPRCDPASDTGTTHAALFADSQNFGLFSVDGQPPQHQTTYSVFNDSYTGTTDYFGEGGVIALFGRWLFHWKAGPHRPDMPWNAGYTGNLGHDPDVVPLYSVMPGDGAPACDCDRCRMLLRDGYGLGPTAPVSSIADRHMHFASRVAAQIERSCTDTCTDPPCDCQRGLVHALAYDQYGQPPVVPIRRNVLVSLTHDGSSDFQPFDMYLRDWGAKRDAEGFQLGDYEYWGLPATTMDRPRLALGPAMDRLKLLARQRVRHFIGESTTGAGAAGLHWYVAQRLAWNPAADVGAILDEFFLAAFGPAGPASDPPAACTSVNRCVRRAFDRWAGRLASPAAGNVRYLPGPWELGELFADLATADGLPMTAAIRQRLDEVEAYAEFLRLIDGVDRIAGDSQRRAPQLDAAIDPLLVHVWRMWSSGSNLVNAHQVHLWALGLGSPALSAAWALPALDAQQAASWRASHVIEPFSARGACGLSELACRTRQNRALHPRVPVVTANLDVDVRVPVLPSPPISWSGGCTPSLAPGSTACADIPKYADDDASDPYSTTYQFAVTPTSSGPIVMELSQGVAARGKIRITLSGPDCPSATGCRATSEEVPLPPPDAPTQTVFWTGAAPAGKVPLSTGTYRLRVDMFGYTTYLQFRYPDSVPFVRVGPQPRIMAPVMFFAVPRGVSRFLYQTSGSYTGDPWITNPGFRVLAPADVDPTRTWTWNGTGKAVPAGPDAAGSSIEYLGAGTWSVRVHPDDAGRVWLLGNPKGSLRLINLPNLFARNPWQLLVGPGDL